MVSWGKIYAEGKLVERDLAQTVSLYRRALEAGVEEVRTPLELILSENPELR